MSTKVDKFKGIIEKRQLEKKPTDTIKIQKMFDQEEVLLFQDMFPILEKYIECPYIKGGQHVGLYDPSKIEELEKAGKKVIKLIKRGIKFTPTQPDVLKIMNLMLGELNEAAATLDEN